MNNAMRIVSKVTDAITVSSTRVREGRTTWWETSLVANGQTSDGLRTSDKAAASACHDAVCDAVNAVLNGRRDPRSARQEFVAMALTDVGVVS